MTPWVHCSRELLGTGAGSKHHSIVSLFLKPATSSRSSGPSLDESGSWLMDFFLAPQAIFGDYCQEILRLVNKYGVYDEGELLSGQVHARDEAVPLRSVGKGREGVRCWMSW